MKEDIDVGKTIGQYAFLVGAGVAIFGALIHWSAPFLGVNWYAFLHSPDWVVDSARNGTWAAPLGAVLIGALMFICALYAFAGAGMMRGMPLVRTGLLLISTVCVLRGLLLVPLLVTGPGKVTPFDIVGSLIWLLAGISYLYGTTSSWALLNPANSSSNQHDVQSF